MDPIDLDLIGRENQSPDRSGDQSASEKCPFCSGLVLQKAPKCRHCGETLDVVLRAAEEAKRLAQLISQGLASNQAESQTAHGFVYIMINPAMPTLLKIGMTTKQPAERAQELSQGTGMPTVFHVAYSVEVRDCKRAESLVHSRLAQFRVNQGREFFNVPLEVAIRELNRLGEELGRATAAGTNQIRNPVRPSDESPFSEGQSYDATYRPTRDSMLSVLAIVRRHFRQFVGLQLRGRLEIKVFGARVVGAGHRPSFALAA